MFKKITVITPIEKSFHYFRNSIKSLNTEYTFFTQNRSFNINITKISPPPNKELELPV